jgi:hypothetical protein
MSPWIYYRRSIWTLLGFGAYLALLGACDLPARVTGMIPISYETARKHPGSVFIIVTGGQTTNAVGRPLIPNSAFAQALVLSIEQSQTFARVIKEESLAADFLLTATLFALDKRVFGRAVKLEVGWILRRRNNGIVTWQESIVSESTEGNMQVATEGAARNNIVQALTKISKLNL